MCPIHLTFETDVTSSIYASIFAWMCWELNFFPPTIFQWVVKFLPTNVEANQVTRVGFGGNLFLEYFHLSRIIQKCLFPLYNNFDTFDLANNFAGPESTILFRVLFLEILGRRVVITSAALLQHPSLSYQC